MKSIRKDAPLGLYRLSYSSLPLRGSLPAVTVKRNSENHLYKNILPKRQDIFIDAQ